MQKPSLPAADLLAICGDLTGRGSVEAFEEMADWLGEGLKQFPLGAVFTPGNHDIGLDGDRIELYHQRFEKDPYHYPRPRLLPTDSNLVRGMLEARRVRVLIDEACEIEGIKFWGTPWTPTFMEWAFMGGENFLSKKWAEIPKDTQVLISHGPAQGLRDFCGGGHVGSSTLRYFLDDPTNLPDLKVHAFGHIHEGSGWHQQGRYLCLNASVLDGFYNGFNDIPVLDTETWSISDVLKDEAV